MKKNKTTNAWRMKRIPVLNHFYIRSTTISEIQFHFINNVSTLDRSIKKTFWCQITFFCLLSGQLLNTRCQEIILWRNFNASIFETSIYYLKASTGHWVPTLTSFEYSFWKNHVFFHQRKILVFKKNISER